MPRPSPLISITQPQATPDPARPPSPTLLPNDHAAMLVELLRPLGVERARRWLAALLLVPFADRDDVVAAVESRIVTTYGATHGQADAPETDDESDGGSTDSLEEFTLVSAPKQKDGYVEQVERTYARRKPGKGDAQAASKPKRKRAG